MIICVVMWNECCRGKLLCLVRPERHFNILNRFYLFICFIPWMAKIHACMAEQQEGWNYSAAVVVFIWDVCVWHAWDTNWSERFNIPSSVHNIENVHLHCTTGKWMNRTCSCNNSHISSCTEVHIHSSIKLLFTAVEKIREIFFSFNIIFKMFINYCKQMPLKVSQYFSTSPPVSSF